MNDSEWKEVPNHPGYYVNRSGQVASSLSRVPSKVKPKYEASANLRIMYLHKNCEGYLFVRLRPRRKVRVHCLILEAFVGPRPKGYECRHLNGNPGDNRLENLAWGTRSENQRDRREHGTLVGGERHGRSKLSTDQVRRMREMFDGGIQTRRQLASEFQISRSQVDKIVGRRHRVTDPIEASL